MNTAEPLPTVRLSTRWELLPLKLERKSLTLLRPGTLSIPLRVEGAATFYCDDVFDGTLNNWQIAAVFGVMAASPSHTFVLGTAHPQTANEWFEWLPKNLGKCATPALRCGWYAEGVFKETLNVDSDPYRVFDRVPWGPSEAERCPWPLPNVTVLSPMNILVPEPE